VHGTARDIARVGANAWRRRSVAIDLDRFNCVILYFFSTEVDKVINNKVVDLLILYHFHKRRIAFFSTISAQFGCQDTEFLGSSE
jgi:hypothetical protein